jgi:hypothetical protein
VSFRVDGLACGWMGTLHKIIRAHSNKITRLEMTNKVDGPKN